MRPLCVKTASKDANSTQPEFITNLVIEAIRSLEQDPKTDYLKAQFLNKFVSSETDAPELRRSRAIEKWLATESRNEETNVRLLHTLEEYHILPRVTFKTFVSFARDVVRQVIGDTIPKDALIGIFSGGASTSRKRTESHPALKYLGKADITRPALDFWELIAPEMPGWVRPETVKVNIVEGNVLFTVPKKTDIDRCACKEPDLNMFMQKGIGNVIRRCLKRSGIDLNDQTRNRSLARIGSLDNSLATLDLSSASDSVTTELVALLLPDLWYSTMTALRCPVTIIDGVEHRNEMFSSMGNGFTFELESLLFYALARTTAYFAGIRGIISVYGDDIIVPSTLAFDLIEVLRFFGFETNVEKSFYEGPFRESCGGHYYNGLDVTPFYLKAPIRRLTDLIHVANQLRRWSHDGFTERFGILDSKAYDLWVMLRDLVPSSLWGGRDTSFKFALVTPDSPRGMLSPKVEKVYNADGGFYHWLNITWDRGLPGCVETQFRSIQSGSYRKRPNRVVNSDVALFVEEL